MATLHSETPGAAHERSAGERLRSRYRAVREQSERLAAPLAIEDMVVQSMPDCSPAKWHLAHTTWFFERFCLRAFQSDYAPFDDDFEYLFNSYYTQVSERHPRPCRGMITRPTVEHVRRYRRYVDDAMQRLLEGLDEDALRGLAPILEVGLNHEQQHQELLLTDLKHLLSLNPLQPSYRGGALPAGVDPGPMGWVKLEEGVRSVGFEGSGFSFDNEGPRHRVFLEPFALADRLVTNAEYEVFIADGGYRRAELWLDEGWATVQREAWTTPLYWKGQAGDRSQFTLHGPRPLDPHEPAVHLSFYEADAYACWAGARLPTEFEWEVACREQPVRGNLLERDRLHPAGAADAEGPIRQAFGDAWEWTRSAYEPYPGYRPPPGAIGEYNGKFMCSQQVLRGGSCVTPADHLRPTYRNFFYPGSRWQFAGVRLARSIR